MTEDQPARIAGVVLAAGTSSRMGRNKLFLPLGGISVLRRAVASAGRAGLDPVLVVLGHGSDRALAELEGLTCIPVINEEYARGMNTSVRAGISVVPDDASGAGARLSSDNPPPLGGAVTDRLSFPGFCSSTVNGDELTGQIAGMSGAIVKLRRQR